MKITKTNVKISPTIIQKLNSDILNVKFSKSDKKKVTRSFSNRLLALEEKLMPFFHNSKSLLHEVAILALASSMFASEESLSRFYTELLKVEVSRLNKKQDRIFLEQEELAHKIKEQKKIIEGNKLKIEVENE